MYDALRQNKAGDDAIIWDLIVTQLWEQQYARLEQARLETEDEARLQLQQVFVDLPFAAPEQDVRGYVIDALCSTAMRCHSATAEPYATTTLNWAKWRRHPERARTWFVRAGPGQGKSTLTQYFAQLQRAHFLLRDDAPFIRADRRKLASDIRATARRWPTAARIPISVELKDFAQWFGERAKKEPRRVTSYIADRWRLNLAREVTPEIVERLLSTRQWFLVFDGLDEVPGDVKDDVAKEIRYFLDEVAVRLNADLFTVCTSRPQGYSGQFAELDVCGVELSTLTVDEALKCAEPVLVAGRTETEAKQVIADLTEASKQASVRELMTTPLQSHIMAIVVRAGGKPPERRWALYQRFYDVIRNREKRRAPPDSRLAAVLADPAIFLKTMHDRLGLALHAAAETSGGAKTTMERERFRHLVTAAGRELLQIQVDETIDAIMAATTERLVLVNTPDDGNHLRFDVRQLQEFFAGEFFYDRNTVAPSFRERFELVAGDAHWPEVVHFLLSGLVANNQDEKLAVAGSVLRSCDAADGEAGLNRRLGRGAIAVARLFGEGVLEDDRYARDALRDVLTPLFGSTEPDALAPLMAMNHPNSRAWLIDVLADSFTLLMPSERIGGLAVLGCIMPDDHPRLPEVRKYTQEAPAELLALAARAAASGTSQPWFREELLRCLASRRFLGLSGPSLRDMLERMATPSGDVRVAAASVLDPRSAALFSWLFALHFEVDPDIISHKIEGPSLYVGSPPPEGTLFSLLHQVERFAATTGIDDLRQLCKVMTEGDPAVAAALPSYIRKHIPIDFAGSLRPQLAMLAAATPEALELQRRSVVNSDRIPAEGSSCETRKPYTFNFDDLADAIVEYPVHFLRELPIARSTMKALPERAASIRAALRRVAPMEVPAPSRGLGFGGAFSLDLPADVSLLPHAAATMFEPVPGVFGYSTTGFVGYVLPISAAQNIRDSGTFTRAQRLAAMLFCWNHEDGDGMNETGPNIGEIYDPVHARWFIRGATSTLSRLGSPSDPRSRSIANQLIDLYRENYRDRDMLNSILAMWREMPASPISGAGVANKWLKL